MAADAPAVELRGIWHSFDEHDVLRDVSFTAPAGRITVMLGPSGVGKTTCLRILCGLQVPDDGEVLIGDRSLYAMRPRELRALQKRLGVLLAGHGVYGSALWAHLSVLENIVFQLHELTSLSEEEALERARARLSEVGLGESFDVMPADLSAGMRRRVALARALASDPDVLVLDAPELGIDSVRRLLISEVVMNHHAAAGGTYLIVTQSIEMARRMADHVVVLLDGRVAASGPAAEVLESADVDIQQLLTGSETGSLQLASERGEATAPGDPQGQTIAPEFVPASVAALILLTLLTASTAVLGFSSAIEWALVAALWLVVAVVLGVRWRRRARG